MDRKELQRILNVAHPKSSESAIIKLMDEVLFLSIPETPNNPKTIVSRKCEHCGHHEIGYVAETFSFIPLKPGDEI